MSKLRRVLVVAAAGCVLVAIGWLGRALADRGPMAPPIVYSGRMLMGGNAVADGDHMVQLALFSSMSGPTGNLCDNGVVTAHTNNGHFSVALNTACANVFTSAATVYVDLTVDGTALTSRTRASAVPFAVQTERVVYRSGTQATTDGLYAGTSASTTNGAVSFTVMGTPITGYQGARAACIAAVSSPTAHLCTGIELVRSAALGIVIPGGAWYANGTYSAYSAGTAVRDCGGFTSASSVQFAPVWSAPNNPDAASCDTVRNLLCCD